MEFTFVDISFIGSHYSRDWTLYLAELRVRNMFSCPLVELLFSPINRVAIGIMARREPQHAQDFKMYCVLVTNYGFPLDGFVRELPAAAAERLLFPAVVGVFLAAADARLLPPLA